MNDHVREDVEEGKCHCLRIPRIRDQAGKESNAEEQSAGVTNGILRYRGCANPSSLGDQCKKVGGRGRERGLLEALRKSEPHVRKGYTYPAPSQSVDGMSRVPGRNDTRRSPIQSPALPTLQKLSCSQKWLKEEWKMDQIRIFEELFSNLAAQAPPGHATGREFAEQCTSFKLGFRASHPGDGSLPLPLFSYVDFAQLLNLSDPPSSHL